MLAPLKSDTERVFSVADAPLKLLEQLELLQQTGFNATPGSESIIRLEIPVAAEDPLPWLIAQESCEKTFWSDRDADACVAGIGAALVVKDPTGSSHELALQRMRRLLQHAPESVRFYGGMRFSPDSSPAHEWQEWGGACFTLPEIEFSRERDRAILASHLVHSGAVEQNSLDRLQGRIASLVPAQEIPQSLPIRYLKREIKPGHEEWCRQVEQGLEKIRLGVLQKFVLARVALFELENSHAPLQLLAQLRKHAPHAFHFCFQHGDTRAFLGITPERLYRRTQRRIESEAVASTRPRGKDAQEDERLTWELLSSGKEVREHLMVLDRMERLLREHCLQTSRLSYLEPLRLTHVQHLKSRVEGQLRPDIGDSVLLPAFHPTPAVCGTPNSEARELIRELEPFDRGWYAGPVGWIGKSRAEFAVALRSGLLDGNILRVYSGAGIVEGSVPDAEWREVEVKLRSWHSLLEPV